MSYPYLKDSPFLKEMDRMKNKEQYIKIIVLDFEEKPIREIQGEVVSGSLNLDGTSSIRRTGNLTMITKDFNNNLLDVNRIFSINKKIKIEIGFKNNTFSYLNYEYIWFPLGLYVISNLSISNGNGGVTLSLQIKDKMCLLNGECGGTLPASVVFNEHETVDENGNVVLSHPTIYQIIIEAVNHFGGEQLGKIIISDVDTRIKKVMKWVGSSPLYIIKKISGGVVQYIATTDSSRLLNEKNYDIYEYGEDIGYIYTDFIYPGELVGDAGGTVCDILDKIKDTLGNYEYFYDVEGNFIFQEKKNYLNTTHAKVKLDEMAKEDYLIDMDKGKSVYTFDDGSLITSYSNTPQYNMIKNDFIVWGMKENINGKTFPIRYHLSIDKKPKEGNSYKCFFYEDPDDKIIKAKCPIVFPNKNSFPKTGVIGIFYMAEDTKNIYKWDAKNKEYISIAVGLDTIVTKDWRTELYLSGVASEPYAYDSNYYYTELSNEWAKLYDVKNGKFYEETLKFPSDIDYFLDFIDSPAAISEFNISNIGRRTKVVNDDSINCIFEPEIPNLILLNLADKNISALRKECEEKGEDYIQLEENIFNMITGGGNFNSAYNLVRELLYQYTSYNESITLNTIPIYYLEPNTRITVRDNKSGIYGDYLINSISLPLDISGEMTISCIKALERL